ncbi:hypothetical protein HAX54_040271, partial [Datura stramonium]|nr:hypothetical protein [Datura stramonium]
PPLTLGGTNFYVVEVHPRSSIYPLSKLMPQERLRESILPEVLIETFPLDNQNRPSTLEVIQNHNPIGVPGSRSFNIPKILAASALAFRSHKERDTYNHEAKHLTFEVDALKKEWLNIFEILEGKICRESELEEKLWVLERAHFEKKMTMKEAPVMTEEKSTSGFALNKGEQRKLHVEHGLIFNLNKNLQSKKAKSRSLRDRFPI